MKSAIGLLLLLCLTGCVQRPPDTPAPLPAVPIAMFRVDAQHTGVYRSETLDTHLTLAAKYDKVNWGIHTACKSSPISANGTIYVGADSGYLHSIDDNLMTRNWRFKVRPQAAYGIHSSPAVDANAVYFGAYDGYMYALRSGGQKPEKLWEVQLGGAIGSSPVLSDTRLYVTVETVSEGYVAALERSTGRELWRSANLGAPSHSTPTLSPDGKLLLVGANNGDFCALSVEDGRLVWRFDTTDAVKSTAAAIDDRVVFSSWDTYIYCLRIADGALLWKFKTGDKSMSSPAVSRDTRRVYCGSHDGALYCIDLDSGQSKWKFQSKGPISSSPVLVRRRYGPGWMVVVGSNDRSVYGIDGDGGAMLFQYTTAAEVTSSPLIYSGRLYVSGNDGFLYKWQ